MARRIRSKALSDRQSCGSSLAYCEINFGTGIRGLQFGAKRPVAIE